MTAKITTKQAQENYTIRHNEIEAKQYLNYWLKMRGLTQADITGTRKGKRKKHKQNPV